MLSNFVEVHTVFREEILLIYEGVPQCPHPSVQCVGFAVGMAGNVEAGETANEDTPVALLL